MRKASEQVGVLGAVSPAEIAVGTADTEWTDASLWNGFMGVVQAGALGVAATLDASIRQATDDAGASAKAVTGASIVQLESGAGNDMLAVINCDANELDRDNGFTFVSLRLTVGTDNSFASGVLYGVGPRYGPASDSDSDIVDSISN